MCLWAIQQIINRNKLAKVFYKDFELIDEFCLYKPTLTTTNCLLTPQIKLTSLSLDKKLLAEILAGGF